MKRVVLLGATGMLGNAVYDVFKDDYELVLAVRNPKKLPLLDKTFGGVNRHSAICFDAAALYADFTCKKGHPGEQYSNFLRQLGDVDFVINAIGVTIPFSLKDPALTFFVNGALPHILASTFGERLIHITTDCVYSGKQGFPYDEKSPKSPPDVYGLSKSLGEPADCLTIRTSIIGRELDGFTGLLEWFLQQKGKTITGFANHFWNGITTHQFGHCCDQIMRNRGAFPRSGIYHVFSTVISKYDMLLRFREHYNLDCTILADRQNTLNRTLNTVKELRGMLQIHSFDQMVDALAR
jgi:dTDP-4-dehydrorhamnose reductase